MLFDRRLSLQTILKCGVNERREEWMRRERFGFEFGMELAAKEPGMFVARKLYDLDELSVGGDAAENQAAFLQTLTISRIEFVAMPMTFADLARTVIGIATNSILLIVRVWRKAAHPG